MFDFIGKRFCGYLVTLIGGGLAAYFIADGVQLSHFYAFSTTLFGIYVGGQTVSDTVAKFKGSAK